MRGRMTWEGRAWTWDKILFDRLGPEEVVGGRAVLEVVAIDPEAFSRGGLWARRLRMRDAVATGGSALPKDDPPDTY